MTPSTPFVDRESGEFDLLQIVEEAIPVAKLIGFFVAVSLVPFAFAAVLSVLGLAFAGALFTLAAQFVLAVGTAVVLLYVLVRARRLAAE